MNIRQSTARTILIGPILDADGVAKTDEVVGSILASKNGGAPAALNASATLTHTQAGYYRLALTTTDTNTLGCLELTLNSGTNTMPIRSLNVLAQAAWDALHSVRIAAQVDTQLIASHGNGAWTTATAVSTSFTQSAAQVAAALTGTVLTITTADRLTVSITDVGDLSDRTELWFAVKSDRTDDDDDALILVSESTGLEVINAGSPTAAGNGSITVTDGSDGDLTVVVEGVETTKLSPLALDAGKRWALKVLRTSGALTTLLEGKVEINEGIVQDLS